MAFSEKGVVSEREEEPMDFSRSHNCLTKVLSGCTTVEENWGKIHLSLQEEVSMSRTDYVKKSICPIECKEIFFPDKKMPIDCEKRRYISKIIHKEVAAAVLCHYRNLLQCASLSDHHVRWQYVFCCSALVIQAAYPLFVLKSKCNFCGDAFSMLKQFGNQTKENEWVEKDLADIIDLSTNKFDKFDMGIKMPVIDLFMEIPLKKTRISNRGLGDQFEEII